MITSLYIDYIVCALAMQVVDPLLEYLHHNLQTFVKHLDPIVLKM